MFLKRFYHLLIFEEFIFLAALSLWCYIRAHFPDINGLEKYADYGFINSALRSESMPPMDMWYFPESINYYYFGHFVTAVLTKLSNIDSAITYNLMVSTVFSLSFVSCFSLSSNLVSLSSRGNTFSYNKIIILGLLSCCLLTLGGNLHTIIHIWDGIGKYWYPDATRYIPFTIHEFPLYSFVIADLHGHLNNIPYVIFGIAVLLSLIIKFDLRINKWVIPYLVFFGFNVGIYYITNSIDAAIYMLLPGFIIFIINIYKGDNFLNVIAQSAIITIIVIFCALLFTLPFQLHFKPFASSIGFVKDRSPFQMLLVLWGFFWFYSFSFIIALINHRWSKINILNNIIKKVLTVINSFFGYEVKQKIIQQNIAEDSDKITKIDLFVFSIIVTSTLLIMFPEFFYVKDIYQNQHYRTNTVFKFVFQSYILYSIILGYIIFRINQILIRPIFILWIVILSIGYLSVMIYPYFAINGYYQNLNTYRGLNGIKYLEKYPDDYKAILWMRNNIEGTPTIVEAVGESFTEYARVSANTGLPTIVGWRVHEWLWRGSFDPVGKRSVEVSDIYTSNNVEKTKQLIKKYNVQYIFIGKFERDQYKNLNEEKIKSVSKEVFRSNDTVIYQILENT